MSRDNIGNKIRDARRINNLTQKQLADKIGCSVVTISRWEHGKFNPSHEEMEKLREILDLSEKEITDSKENIKEQNSSIEIELSKINLSIDGLRKELLINERKKYQKIILAIVIAFILLFFVFFLITDWRKPQDTEYDSAVVFYNYGGYYICKVN